MFLPEQVGQLHGHGQLFGVWGLAPLSLAIHQPKVPSEEVETAVGFSGVWSGSKPPDGAVWMGPLHGFPFLFCPGLGEIMDL